MPEGPIIRTAALRRAAGELIRTPIPDDEAVDVAGEVFSFAAEQTAVCA